MKLGIFHLLQPPFGLGLFTSTMPPTGLSQLPNVPSSIISSMPSQLRDFLAVFSVEELHTAYDEQAIVYFGKVQVGGDGLVENTPTYRAPSGNLIEPGDISFQFRITFPRAGSASIATDITNLFGGLNAAQQADFGDMQTMLQRLGGTTSADIPSDFPSKNFRIELLFNTLVLHLPNDRYLPARLAADGWLERDPNFDDVTIHLPKIAMSITQNADDYGQTKVDFEGWGINSLDEDADLLAGEMIAMKPALCLHSSNVVGFGLEKVVLDLSVEFTPAEILQKNFGVGDEFRGLWIPQVRFFLAPSGLRGMAFDTWGQDLLIDFDQGLSGEIGMELVNNHNRAPLQVDVVFYEGNTRKTPTKRGDDAEDSNHNITRTSFIFTATNAEIQLRIRGGRPPYTATIRVDGNTITPQPFNGDNNRLRYPMNATTSGRHNVSVRVEDSLQPQHRFWQENIEAQCIAAGQNTGNATPQIQPAQLQMLSGAPSFLILKASSQPDDDAVFITTNPANATVTSGGSPITGTSDGSYRIPVQRNGTRVQVQAEWAITATPEHFILFRPTDEIGAQLRSHGENLEYLQMIFDRPREQDSITEIAQGLLNNATVRTAFESFLGRRNGRTIRIYSYASYERKDDSTHTRSNLLLSQRRGHVLKQLLIQLGGTSIEGSISYDPAVDAKGASVAMANSRVSPARDPIYHVAVAVYETELPTGSPNTASAEVWREEDVVQERTSVADPTPAPTEPERPSPFRRIGAKVRFQRNELVYAELFGEFDVIDEARRSGTMIQSADSQNGTDTSGVNGAVTSVPGASRAASQPGGNTPENQGVIDFKISMLYDVATRRLTQTLAVGFDRNNTRDGFVHVNRFNPEPLANTMASLLLFAPLIQGGIEAIQSADTDEETTEAVIIAATEIGVATLLGLFVIKMEKITLFDAELTFTEISPDIWLWNAQQLTDVGILLDYAVDFKVNLNLFGVVTIRTKDNDPATQRRLLPPRARYKAIGFKLAIDPVTRAVKYQPVFDTSKGYEFSLGDPGALEVMVGNVSLNNLLRVLSMRLSRENPMVFEADLALNINLGVVSIDHVRVRLRIYTENDPVNVVPEIIPTKVSVNIPGALSGTGYLDFGNGSDSAVPGAAGGFQGYVDVTVVPVKLRIAAAVGIKPISTPEGREATAFFLGLEVELPAGIPLGNTGLGIFGFLGLFAMHYKRLEQEPQPGQLPPALNWFYQTVQGNVIDITGWGPELDRWSFGVGIILGTMEGGFVLNLKGMFILELPGPRILILVKASLLFPKPPDVKAAGRSQSVGILAVIDLDFNIGRLTIGFILDYNIESLLSLRVPVVSQFSFNQPKDWFVDIGNNLAPAQATILGIVRGYAYTMIHGNGITNWPKMGDPQRLFGFSLALGVGASIVFGDRDSGLYLEVRADFHAGISFSPLHFYGMMELRGKLNLWIVSISAWANLEVEGPDPHTYIHGKACGKVSFFFFDIEGCVDIEINDEIDLAPPPDLLTSLTLVSRSSALLAGQGVDRPIDGALGKAAVKDVDVIDASLLTVPIDSIPVLNLFATPDVNGCTTFTDPIAQSSTYTVEGYVSTSAKNYVRYKLISIELNETLLEASKPKPVRFWKKSTDNAGDEESGVDMALLCWMPDPTPRAVQRSQELTTTITNRWENVCKQIAPATSVFYTFNQKPLGYSTSGWKLSGKAWPDPPGTIRSKLPDTDIYVYENRFPDDLPSMAEAWLLIRNSIVDHAKVIGGEAKFARRIGRVLQLPFEGLAKITQQPELKILPETRALIEKFECENILIDCGELVAAEILLAMPLERVMPEDVIIRTLDKDLKIIRDARVTDYAHEIIWDFTQLPNNWELTSGPWFPDASPVWNFINSFDNNQKRLMKVLLHYKGEKNMRFIQLVVARRHHFPDAPSLLLCALETLSAAEFIREEHDTSTQQSDQGSLQDALSGEPLRALLKPATTYEMTVKYAFQRKNDKGLIDDDFVDAPLKTFVFKTDSAAPIRIDPWVLTTTPQNDMQYHFRNDPVQLYLNDESLIQLFKAYGINLEAKVLNANGNHPVTDPPSMKLDMSNIHVNKITAAIKTPFLHTLEEVASTTNSECIDTVEESEQHVVFTIGVEWLLNTEYNVEIIKEGDTIDPSTNAYRTPLYKFAFRTSRYDDAAHFAGRINGTHTNTRLLKSTLALLSNECTDNQLQTALLEAGLPAMPPAENINVSFLWSSIASGGTVTDELEAILIDVSEPLWRQRPYPHSETITAESGDVKHWSMKNKLEMEIVEAAGSSVVEQITRTVSGTRTIVYLKADAAGKPLHLVLRKHVFTHIEEKYGTVGTYSDHDVLNFILPSIAPWAEED